jgi:hypothetical protein
MQRALDWIWKSDPFLSNTRDPYLIDQMIEDSTTRKSKGEPESGPVLLFTFPHYFVPRLESNPARESITFDQFIDQPVMGIWILSVRSRCQNRLEAAQAIAKLCQDTDLQQRFVNKGCVPVHTLYSQYTAGRFWSLRRNNGAETNLERMAKCLARSKPRPRTKDWTKLEDEIGSTIRARRRETGR